MKQLSRFEALEKLRHNSLGRKQESYAVICTWKILIVLKAYAVICIWTILKESTSIVIESSINDRTSDRCTLSKIPSKILRFRCSYCKFLCLKIYVYWILSHRHWGIYTNGMKVFSITIWISFCWNSTTQIKPAISNTVTERTVMKFFSFFGFYWLCVMTIKIVCVFRFKFSNLEYLLII